MNTNNSGGNIGSNISIIGVIIDVNISIIDINISIISIIVDIDAINATNNNTKNRFLLLLLALLV